MRSKKTLLIDGDILMFKFAFRHQKKITWGNGVETGVLNLERATYDVDEFIDDLKEATRCVDYLVCFTNSINFRYGLFPDYKHNRVNMEPPKLLRELKKHLKENHPWRSEKYLEADDLMGILGTTNPSKYVLATIDKDFESLPVTLYNWNKDRFPHRISLRDADYHFHYQWLKGDTTDGFSGCYLIGDKKARQILDGAKPSEWSTCVVATYATCKKVCYSWEDIVTQARMARILRASDWDSKRKEPILWTPDC